MIPELTVVVSGHLAWSEHLQTPHYVASLLASQANVVYIEPRVAWNRDTAAFSWRQNLSLLRRALRRIRKNLWIYTPWALPLGRFSQVAGWNERLFIKGVRKALAAIPTGHLILWLAETQNGPSIVKCFPDVPRIFHAIDYFDRACDARAAVELARGADLVLAASPAVRQLLKGTNQNIIVFRNGWEFSASEADISIPDEVTRIPHPRVGLVSYLSSNLDYDLLHMLVRTLPLSLILIGRPIGKLSMEDRTLLRALRRIPRVYFLGERSTEQLPGYLCAFDICLAPYKNTPRIYCSDPLKVYQYLAFGKPVVTTPVETLEPLQPLVRIGCTHNEFIAAVREELDKPFDEHLKLRRCEFADRTRWKNRWKELQKVLSCDHRLAALAGAEVSRSTP
jgi:glycosyltransferase involved in cell wall biosynthesis